MFEAALNVGSCDCVGRRSAARRTRVQGRGGTGTDAGAGSSSGTARPGANTNRGAGRWRIVLVARRVVPINCLGKIETEAQQELESCEDRNLVLDVESAGVRTLAAYLRNARLAQGR